MKIALLVLVAFIAWCGSPRHAQAESCTATASNVSFGSVSPISNAPVAATGTVSVTCTWSTVSLTPNVLVCLNLGGTSPRSLVNGSNAMQYDLYLDGGHSVAWGSVYSGTTPASVTLVKPALGTSASATVEQERPEAARALVDEAPPPAPDRAVATATDASPEAAVPPAEQDAAPPVAALNAPAPEVPAKPAETAEGDAAASAEPPVPVMQERLNPAGEPAGEVEHAAGRTPEPTLQPAPASTDRAAAVSPPVLPPPSPPSRAQAAAVSIPSHPPRRARGAAEQVAAPAIAPPSRLTQEQRCRSIVLRAQVGDGPSDADILFLRDGCRAR